MRVTEISFGTGVLGMIPKCLKRGRIKNRGINRDHSDFSIVEIGQNTETCCQLDSSERLPTVVKNSEEEEEEEEQQQEQQVVI